jgi:hypothetical protein
MKFITTPFVFLVAALILIGVVHGICGLRFHASAAGRRS